MKLDPEVRKVLVNARELIKDEEHWTQLTYARDRHGDECDCYADDARRFCAEGAIHRAAYDIDPQMWPHCPFDIVRTFEHYINGRLAHINDAGDHARVIALFDNVLAS